MDWHGVHYISLEYATFKAVCINIFDLFGTLPLPVFEKHYKDHYKCMTRHEIPFSGSSKSSSSSFCDNTTSRAKVFTDTGICSVYGGY